MSKLRGAREKVRPTGSEGVCGRAPVGRWGGAKSCRIFNNQAKEYTLYLVDSRIPFKVLKWHG